MAEPVYVIGSARTDFARNLKREGKSLRDLIVEAGREAIEDAGILPGDVQAGVVGNFAAGLFTRQLHLGAMLTQIDESLRGIPTVHTEAACASGSVAVLTAAQQIMGGLRDVVIVVGAEQQKTMSPAQGADVLGAAGDFEAEKAQFGDFMFPRLFGRIAALYAQRYGLDEMDLARVAVKNRAHAQLNPLAQSRGNLLTLKQASEESSANPRIAPPLKVTDCSQITDGAAALVLCSERFARKIANVRRRSFTKLLGFGQTTDHLSLRQKDVPNFPVARRAAREAYDMAGIGPLDLDGVEVHDCFSISEIIAYEILGLAEPGKGGQLIRSGATALPSARELMQPTGQPEGFAAPVNAGGGLIGDGHPVGASGVRQVVEAARQLEGRAGQRQIPGAKRFLTFNMGGTMTSNVVMVWGRTDS